MVSSPFRYLVITHTIRPARVIFEYVSCFSSAYDNNWVSTITRSLSKPTLSGKRRLTVVSVEQTFGHCAAKVRCQPYLSQQFHRGTQLLGVHIDVSSRG